MKITAKRSQFSSRIKFANPKAEPSNPMPEMTETVTLSGAQESKSFQMPSLRTMSEVGFAGALGVLAGACPLIGAAHNFGGAIDFGKRNPLLAATGVAGTVANLSGAYALAQGNYLGAALGLGISAATVTGLMFAPE